MELWVGGGKQPFRILQRENSCSQGLVRPALLKDVPMLWAAPEPQKLLKKISLICASLTSGNFPQLSSFSSATSGGLRLLFPHLKWKGCWGTLELCSTAPASRKYLKWHGGIPSLEGVRAAHSQAFGKRKTWKFAFLSWSGYGVPVGPCVNVMTIAANMLEFQKSRWSDKDPGAGKHFKVWSLKGPQMTPLILVHHLGVYPSKVQIISWWRQSLGGWRWIGPHKLFPASGTATHRPPPPLFGREGWCYAFLCLQRFVGRNVLKSVVLLCHRQSLVVCILPVCRRDAIK